MRHYIITGGAGFIGSNLVRQLFKTEPGVQISCIDDFDPFYSAEIKKFNIRDFKDNPSFKLIEADLATTDPASLAALVPGKVDAIIHLAAKAGVRPALKIPELSASERDRPQNLLDFARLKGIEQFVFASSSRCFWHQLIIIPWKEEEKLMPHQPLCHDQTRRRDVGTCLS
jgi:UDP-glucuronate 4-epimerase